MRFRFWDPAPRSSSVYSATVPQIVLVIVIVSVISWQIFHTGQVAISSDATAAQTTTSHRLAELSEKIKDLKGRVTAMERLLQEV